MAALGGVGDVRASRRLSNSIALEALKLSPELTT